MKTCFEDAIAKKEKYKEMGKELNRLIKLPFDDKLELTMKTIKEALRDQDKPIIASSFGKDSIVLIHTIHRIDNTVPIVFTNTGVNFRETMHYMKEIKELWNLKIYELKPEITFWKIVKEHGYPKQSRNTKTGDKREPACCKILKFNPMHKFNLEYKPSLVFVGLLGDEGRQRRWAYIYKGGPIYEHKAEKTMKCIPLIWWTREDIWKYHDIYDIPRNPAYEKYQIERTGCIPCTGHIGWEEQLARTFPALYKKVSHAIGQNLIEDYNGGR